MEVKLDDIDLVKRVQASATSPLSEVRTVQDVHVEGKRSIVELKIPGSDGNVLQDMGREPLTILLKGEVWGPDAKTTVRSLKAKSDTGGSVPFTSDLLAATSVSDVIIEEFEVDQIAGNPTRYRYLMLLREFKEGGEAVEGAAVETGEMEKEGREEPATVMGEAGETPPNQTEEAEEEVAEESDLHDIVVRVRDSAGDPIRETQVTVTGPDGEHKAKTDEEGYVALTDVPQGEYQITVDDDRFRDVKQSLKVTKKGKRR